MSLADKQHTIIEVLKQRLSGVVQDVRPHRGQFKNLKEIKKIATCSPCVLVSYLSIKAPQEFTQPHADVRWVIYIVTEERFNLDRTTLASQITESLIHVLMRQDWGLDCNAPVNLTARNITTTDIDNEGMSLWAIAFDQNMPIETQGPNTAYTQLLEIVGEHKQAEGAPVARDHIAIEQP